VAGFQVERWKRLDRVHRPVMAQVGIPETVDKLAPSLFQPVRTGNGRMPAQGAQVRGFDLSHGPLYKSEFCWVAMRMVPAMLPAHSIRMASSALRGSRPNRIGSSQVSWFFSYIFLSPVN